MPAKLTQEQAIAKAIDTHGIKYSYDKVLYEKMIKKVIITCPKHGDFQMSLHNHVTGKQNCPKCAREQQTENTTKTQEEFITEIKKAQGNKFDLSNTIYKGALNQVTVIHNACGREFTTTPNVLKRAKTCFQCSIEQLIRRNKDINVQCTTDIVEKLKPDYELLSKYTKAKNKITVRHVCGKEFTATADSIIRNRGCPHCSKTAFDSTKPAILYYISVLNGTAYKIGITNLSVKERFKKYELDYIDIVKEWYYENGTEAYSKEQEILKQYKDYKYTGDLLLHSGNTELFYKDILNLDIKETLYVNATPT